MIFRKTIPRFFALIVLAVSLALTSCGNSDNAAQSVPPVKTAVHSDAPIVSQKAYDRGYTEGKKISRIAVGSRERERAIIEVYGMVSALERNGFTQTASDFARGVKAALE